ncbi:glutamine--fructose-6-phosphate transaminase (isomerizing), partial [bacterium]|nr:glutamine--fructose-6-phosphate transaminase (isomerizing) [bacterium]
VEVKNINSEPVTHDILRIEMTLEAIEKGGFNHFMKKEIFEQPQTIEDAMRGRIQLEDGNIKLGGLQEHLDVLRNAKRIIFVACGTSWHAALIGEYMLEKYARIPVEVEYASEFRYREPVIYSDDVVIAISQSGETADTLAAIREAKQKGATVLGICNVVGSTIARETDAGVYIHAGPEIGVASTKAFTSQLTVLALFTLMISRLRHMSPIQGKDLATALRQIPSKVKWILENCEEQIIKIAKEYKNVSNFLYLGRGYNFPTALEGALKLKEISYIHAEGYPAAEMKHGPIALIDKNMPVVVIATRDGMYEKIVSTIEEISAREGRIIVIATVGDEKIREKAEHVIYVPDTLRFLSPLLTIIPLQLLAYHIATLRDCDVDQPRNLAKSVTVE